MSKSRREGRDSDAFDPDAPPPEGALWPGRRSATSGSPSKPVPTSPGKRSLTQHLTPDHPVLRSAFSGPAREVPYRAEMERGFGQSFDSVRAYFDPDAVAANQAMDARAFTVGDQIAFADESPSKELVAHELAHVVQQRGGSHAGEAQFKLATTAPGDAAEHEADEAARTVVAGGVASVGAHDPAIAREKSKDSYDARKFLEQWWLGSGPPQDMTRMLVGLRFVETGPFGKYLAPTAFYNDLIKALVARFPNIDALIAPTALLPLVDRARGLDWEQKDDNSPPVPTDVGPTSYVFWRPVAHELSNALARRYFESIARVFPRFASRIVAKNPPAIGDEQPAFHMVMEHEVLVSHPLDAVIARVLGTLQSPGFGIPFAQAVKDNPQLASAEVVQNRPTTITRRPRLWHWVEATADRTREEVATALFGKPEEAYRLIPMPPLWGYRASDVEAFLPAHREKLKTEFSIAWPMTMGEGMPKDIQFALGMLWEDKKPPEIDPVAELLGYRDPRLPGDINDSSLLVMSRAKKAVDADKAAAGPGATLEKHDEASLVAVLKTILQNLDDLAMLAPLFERSTEAIEATRATQAQRLRKASTTCLADIETSYKLAEQQSGLVSRIAIGMSNAANHLVRAGGEGAPETARGPLGEVADAFLSGIVALELPELARPRVAEAELLLRDVRITIAEASLHQSLNELSSEWNSPSPSHNDPKWQEKHDARERTDQHVRDYQALEDKLAQARMSMRTDPLRTEAEVVAIKPKVDDLGFEIGINEKLDRLNQLWSALEGEEDFWESENEERQSNLLQVTNRKLYNQFKTTVYDPFVKAQKANDDEGKRTARKAYADLLNSKELQDHAKAVIKFLKKVANRKKWRKIIASLVIAFVAFGLGQWQFGAMIAAEATMFEAAIAAGLVTTTTSVVLNKVILDQNPTAIGVITSFVANVGTFFVVGKLAMAARAAGVEAAVAEGATGAIRTAEAEAAGAAGTATTTGTKVGTAAKAVGKYAVGLGKEAVIAEALGFAQAEVEKLLSEGRTLNASEAEELFVHQLIGVVGMRVMTHLTGPDLFQYRGADHKLAAEIDWLGAERKHLEAAGKQLHDEARANPQGKPNKEAAKALMDRWAAYLERQRVARERLLALAKQHPERFKARDLAKLKAMQPDPILVRQVQEARALLSVEQTGVNKFSCDARGLDAVIAQHKAAGSDITKISTDPQTGQRTVTIAPADGAPAFTVTEKLPPVGQRTAPKVPVGEARAFEQWLDARDNPLSPTRPEGQAELRDLYLRDPEAAMNLAAERYGYQPRSMPDTGLIVRADAPGEAGKTAMSPIVTPKAHEIATTLGKDVTAIGNDRYLAPATRMKELRATWAAHKDSRVSDLHYDPHSNTAHFELTVNKVRIRVEAPLEARIESFGQIDAAENRIVGRPVTAAKGNEILHGLVRGEASALEAVGITGEGRLPGDPHVEFGLGELADGSVVIIRGEKGAVDWSGLPGIKPVGHTHPNVKGNNLLGDSIPLAEVLKATDVPLLNRELIFPSAPDFIVVAGEGVRDHVVVTSFVIENGVLMKPGPAQAHLPQIQFRIIGSRQIGILKSGERVFHAKVEGHAGKSLFMKDVWVVEKLGATDNSGHLYMAEPAGLVRLPAPKLIGECFVPGTPVHTPRGLVAIEQLAIGDEVFGAALDGDALSPAIATITQVFVRHVPVVLALDFGSEIVTCSPEHPFFVPGEGWVSAGELVPGSIVATRLDGTRALASVTPRAGRFTVHNIEVDTVHDYFVGNLGLLVHNKPMLGDNLRAHQLVARANGLDPSIPQRNALIGEARALVREIEAGGRPSKSLDKRLGQLRDRIEAAALPRDAAELSARTEVLVDRALKLPAADAAAQTKRRDVIKEAQALKESARQLAADVKAKRDPDELFVQRETIQREWAHLNAKITDLEPPVVAPTPARPAVWQKRLDNATWTDHGGKHTQAKTDAEAKDFSTPTDAKKDPPSQYLPSVDVPALERKALLEGEVIRGDINVPGGTVHLKYRSDTPVGYDRGELVYTMRIEITAGDVFHGHPRDL